MLTPLHLRMARQGLQMTTRELGGLAGISFTTINRFETGKGGLQSNTILKIERSLKSLGIQFLEEGAIAVGPGVCIRKINAFTTAFAGDLKP